MMGFFIVPAEHDDAWDECPQQGAATMPTLTLEGASQFVRRAVGVQQNVTRVEEEIGVSLQRRHRRRCGADAAAADDDDDEPPTRFSAK